MLAKTYLQPLEKIADCPGLFVSKLTPTSPAVLPRSRVQPNPVGASLLAKTYLQPLEKIADCPGLFVIKLTPSSPAVLPRSRVHPNPVGASLLAKTYLQPLEKIADCPGLFVSKLTPTSPAVLPSSESTPVTPTLTACGNGYHLNVRTEAGNHSTRVSPLNTRISRQRLHR